MMRTFSLQSRLARTSCSVLALATVSVVGATPAVAQSFQGTGTVFSGSGSITTGTNTTNIAVTTPQTVIDWVPFDNAVGSFGAIGFQYSGTTATFSGSGNFAVLNRINPADSTRTIFMDGIIQTASLGPGAANGSIYFYSPSGFVIGSNARINVGSLVLSASPILVDGNGSFINGANNQVIFGQALQPTSAITTVFGSQINANAGDAYVAMVAPRVQHGGSINVSGSAALVAAESATINFSPSGLFDIQITSGTSDSQGIVVNGGSITGSASTGSADVHRAYLVAVPKNNALTMLFTANSSLGFDIAGAADVVGNTVVLSAGYDVVGGTISSTRSALGGTGASSITVYDTDFTSQVNASATNLGLFAADTTTASMAAGLSLRAPNAQFNALNSGIHQVVGSVSLDTTNLGTGTGATGGTAYSVATAGGRINIGGNLTLTSQGLGSAGVTGTGGSAYVLADSGGTLSVGGILRTNADGRGGSGALGLGGTIDIIAGPNASLTAGSLNASADGAGGADAGAGAGNGTGGTARLLATGAGSSITIANVVTAGTQDQRDFLSVEGRGGQTNGGGSGIGGTGTGGSLLIRGEAGGSITLPNIPGSIDVRILSRGYGGNASANGTTAGTGVAGTLNLQLDNATLTAGPLLMSGAGLGGFAVGTGNINGGNGIGGTRAISVVNGSTLSVGLPGGIAGGGGGDGSGTGVGGNASGGTASLLVDNSTVNFTSASIITTQNLGGTGFTGGSGSGGNTNVTIRNGGVVNVADDPLAAVDLSIGSNSFGTQATGSTGNGGNATAGNVNVSLQGGTINLTGTLLVSAQAYGGSASGSGSGGNATGGNVNFVATGANNSITGPGVAGFSADAFGGFSAAGNGGNATGGTANVSTATNATLTIASSLVASANGFGGAGGLAGGNGFGGLAQLFASTGSSLTIGGLAEVEADGVGGGDGEGSANGGLGDGGVAAVFSNGGTLTFNDDLRLSASATGGSTFSGIGGAALGGNTRLESNGGTVSISGDLTLTGTAIGGSGRIGGNATAIVSPPTSEGSAVAVALYVRNGGSITVEGQATLDGYATGGAGSNGNGGNAFGGEADVVPFVGEISLGGLTVDVSGSGGDGGNGGNGGNGQGGDADIAFGLGGALINGTTILGSATITADGYGGNGGAGIAANFGGAGGAGGAGAGGGISFTGSAAGGTLESGAAILTAMGTGGQGGSGGNGDSGTGGIGGSGGNGTGGFIQTGTVSNSGSPGSGGGADYSALSIDSSAIGGVGGNGGSGGGGSGAGGDGGDAAGGRSSFLIRGVLGAADSVILMANATGGDGGSGSTAGGGGDAKTGIIGVESKDRFEFPAQRGTLIANSIVGIAAATGGSGSTAGTSTVVDGSYFRVSNGDATIGAVSITLSGDLISSTSGPSFVSARDGTASIGSLSFITDGTLALDANNGAMNADSITLYAANFVPYVLDPAVTNPGTYSASSFDIQTGNNFLTTANLVSDATLTIDAPGLISVGNVTSDGDIELFAGTSISLGSALSGGTIDLDAGSSITGRTMTAGDSFYAEAGGPIGLLGISAGIVNPSGSGASYDVGILSGSTITTGNIAALNRIGLGAAGAITTGTIGAGSTFLALGGGNMSFGAINAGGETYLADDSMIPLGGDASTFDPAPILAMTPVASGGSITLGAVTTGKFVAAAGGALTGTTITSGTSIYTVSGGNTTLADLDAGTSIFQRSSGVITENDLDAGSFIDIRATNGIALGDLVAGDYIDLRSNAAIGLLTALSGETINFQTNGTLTGLSITAGNSVLAQAVGAIQLGTITAGITDQSTAAGANYRVGIASNGTINTGAINALGNIGFGTPTNVTTGNLTSSGGGIMALIGGNTSFGAINTGTQGYVYIGNFSMSSLGGSFATFNRAPILALFPAATGGSITVTGPVVTGNFRASAGTTFNAGNITSDTNILIDTGGNLTVGNLIAGLSVSDDDAIQFNSGGSIVMGNAIAKDGIDFDAEGSVTGGDLTSGREIGGSAGGAVILGNLSAGIVNPQGPLDDDFSVGIESATSIKVGNVTGAESVGFATLGSLTTGNINSGRDFLALVGGNMSFGSISAAGRVYLTNSSMFIDAGGGQDGEDDFDPELVFALNPVPSGGSITAGIINAGSVQAAAGTTLNVGAINAVGRVALSSVGAMQTQAITAGTSLRLTSGGAIDGGNLTAGTLVRVSAIGAVNVGNITRGTAIQAGALGPGVPVEVFGASISTGNIATNGYVGLYTPGSLTVGTINAGRDVIALAGGNAAFGAITTPERFILAGYTNFASLGSGQSFNPGAVFNTSQLASTSGNAVFAGSSAVGGFNAYVGGNTTVASINVVPSAQFDTGYSEVYIDTGGLLSINGTVAAEYVSLTSSDIAIGQSAQINAADGISFISLNSVGTYIGDNLSGETGYRLGQAELDRVKTNQIEFEVDTDRGAAGMMFIGNLNRKFDPGEGDEGVLEFSISDEDSEGGTGTIRVVGNVNLTVGPDQEVEFEAGTFELDAATGSLSLTNSSGALSGILSLEAKNIFVASGDILTKLRQNPQYAGFREELNAPAAVQRPEGVLRAAVVTLGDDDIELENILIQNTGTKATPAGFLINEVTFGFDGDDDGLEGEPAAGSINMVINGQVQTQSGTASGIAVRDTFVTEFGTEIFVTGSTINGCALVGSCSSTSLIVSTVTGSDIQLSGGSGLGDGLFGNEGEFGGDEGGDEGGGSKSSPIAPPNPLFDSRQLTQTGDIDDPVSGAGNPSLYGDTSDEDANDEDCDGSKDNTCTTSTKGDGK